MSCTLKPLVGMTRITPRRMKKSRIIGKIMLLILIDEDNTKKDEKVKDN
jgi:hypothetical protein